MFLIRILKGLICFEKESRRKEGEILLEEGLKGFRGIEFLREIVIGCEDGSLTE